LRYFPNQAFNFAFKDTYKSIFLGIAPPLGMYAIMSVNLLAAGLAGGTALFISYPLEMARTRLATDMGINPVFSSKSSTMGIQTKMTRRYTGILDCLHKIYAQVQYYSIHSIQIMIHVVYAIYDRMVCEGYTRDSWCH
jgi:solute carrier family 25 (adenine nucleotide translocator) protein 4/5/6/31